MENFGIILILLSLVIAGTFTSSLETKQENKWYENLCHGKEKSEKMIFYVQDALGKPNATVWEVARADITHTSPSTFGQVRVVDNLITARPNRRSQTLGRAQGLIASSDLYQTALTMNLNFVFTTGEYNGSTLCISGRNPITVVRNRELPVVGGTGVFRMARGFSISNTYSYDPLKNYGVLEYTLYVCHV